jgi:hypothetical protein
VKTLGRLIFRLWNVLPLGIGVVAALVVISVYGTGPSVVTNGDPVEVDGIVERGQMLDIYFSATRNQVCEQQTSRVLWRDVVYNGQETRDIVPLPDSGLVQLLPGHGRYIVSLPIPPGLASDVWCFQAQVVEQCGWFPSLMPLHPRKSPPVSFRYVGNPGKADAATLKSERPPVDACKERG